MYETYLSLPSGVFADLDRLRTNIDSLFDWGSPAREIRSSGGSAYPPINIGQSPESVDIYVFAPGLDASRTEVTLDRGVLTVAGERASDLPADAPKTSVHGHERFAGRFRRAVSLPDDIDPNHIGATYQDGVLHVQVQRRAAPKPQRIAIN